MIRVPASVSGVVGVVRREAVRSLVVALAVAMVLVGAWGFWRAHADRGVPAAANRALVDATSTAEVQSAVTRALEQVLSYDYSKPTVTKRAAGQDLTGAARKQYDQLFAALQKRAPGQKLVLRATVQSAAVKHLTADRATLLVFLDQSSKRAADKQASASAAQIAITATKVGASWKISSLQPL